MYIVGAPPMHMGFRVILFIISFAASSRRWRAFGRGKFLLPASSAARVCHSSMKTVEYLVVQCEGEARKSARATWHESVLR